MTPYQIDRNELRLLGRYNKRRHESILNRILRGEQRTGRQIQKDDSWKNIMARSERDLVGKENPLVEYVSPFLKLFGPGGTAVDMLIQQADIAKRTKGSGKHVKRFEKEFGSSDATKQFKDALKNQVDAMRMQEFSSNLLSSLIMPVDPTDAFKGMSWKDKLKSVVGKGPEGMEGEFWKAGVDYGDAFKLFEEKMGRDTGEISSKFEALPDPLKKVVKNPFIANLLKKLGGM